MSNQQKGYSGTIRFIHEEAEYELMLYGPAGEYVGKARVPFHKRGREEDYEVGRIILETIAKGQDGFLESYKVISGS